MVLRAESTLHPCKVTSQGSLVSRHHRSMRLSCFFDASRQVERLKHSGSSNPSVWLGTVPAPTIQVANRSSKIRRLRKSLLTAQSRAPISSLLQPFSSRPGQPLIQTSSRRASPVARGYGGTVRLRRVSYGT